MRTREKPANRRRFPPSGAGPSVDQASPSPSPIVAVRCGTPSSAARGARACGRHGDCTETRRALPPRLALAAATISVVSAACGGEAPDARVAFAVDVSGPPIAGSPAGTGRLLVREAARERFVSRVDGECPKDMASIGGRFCIDRYEASLVEADAGGAEAALAPFGPAGGKQVRAVSRRGGPPRRGT